jgi:hypothetical protein
MARVYRPFPSEATASIIVCSGTCHLPTPVGFGQSLTQNGYPACTSYIPLITQTERRDAVSQRGARNEPGGRPSGRDEAWVC